MNHSQNASVLDDEATSDDDLGRDLFVETLKRVLETAASPLVVALYGTWGSGKTSMMLRLRKKLEVKDGVTGQSAATVWFDPWAHSNDDRPAVSLLYAIRKDLGLEKDATVQRALLAIARAAAEEVRLPYIGLSLGKITNTYDKLAREDVERRSQQALLRSRFEDVITTARKKHTGIPLVIFIDDLDRCQPAVAIRLLEAIKLFLNLPGCIFILGVDREPLEAAIAVEYSRLGIARESYLDKIVQLPFTIPALAQKGVEDYIVKHVPEQLQDCRAMLAAAAPDNPRQLKRTINSLFLLDRIAIGSQLPNYNNKIMCSIALIQIAAPDLYQRLRRSPRDWKDVSLIGTDTPPPDWLVKMLIGSDARQGLQAALTTLADEPEPKITDITAYLTLSEQIADSTLAGQHVRTLNERFATAAEQLGSDKPAIRLAGVYAIAGLGDDWEENRQTCVDVLCAYLRMPYDRDPGEDAPEPERLTFQAGREVRHTVIRVITAHLKKDAPVSWQGLNFDFTGAIFDGGDFRDANFSGGTVLFVRAGFSGAVMFNQAEFSGAAVSFNQAEFSGGTVSFNEAGFSGGTVSFNQAEFSGNAVSFNEAGFSGGTVSFNEAGFSSGAVSFNEAEFSGAAVMFNDAGFSGAAVSFNEAGFSGGTVLFNGAKFSSGRVSFNGAKFSGGTVILSDPGDWSLPPEFSWSDTPAPGVMLPGQENQSDG